MDEGSLHDLTAAYALHALDEHEERAYEAHLSACTRCREELAVLGEAAGALAFAAPTAAPPPALRERIVAAAAAPRANVRPLRPRWAYPAAAAAAVAACAALGLGIWGATVSQRLHDRDEALADARTAAAIVADPAARRVPLEGAEGALVVAGDGRAALVVERIGAAAEGRTYEAWVMRGGRAQPAGLFRGGGRTLLPLSRAVPQDAVVAVTLEPKGGSRRPTSRPLFQAQA